jgi:uncharacterized protein (DUF302 family)
MFDARYTFGTRVSAPLDEVRDGVIAALRTEGFGVLTEIDVAATLRAKLGIEREPYLILGACNPPFAHQAIGLDPAIGALLPCNVVLRAEGDAIVVEAMDPAAVLALVDAPGIDDVASEVRARLQRAVAVVEEQFAATESRQ